jgi:anti-sigma B factor antagonist
MFEATLGGENEVLLNGRFDASQVERARIVFDALVRSTRVNFKDLEYISSAGLGVLIATQKRLSESGQKLKLCNLTGHVKDIFYYAGFDKIFEME